MHHGVKDGEEADDKATHLVKIDVLIKRQIISEPSHPKPRDAVAQHKNHDECTVEVQSLTYSKRELSDLISEAMQIKRISIFIPPALAKM